MIGLITSVASQLQFMAPAIDKMHGCDPSDAQF